MRVLSFLVLSVAMTLSGCATIVHGTTQAIPITTSPPGAHVSVDSVPIGVTPLLATVSRKKSHIVSIAHDSFPPVSVVLDRNVSPWVAGNLLLEVLPAIIDFTNGAAYGFVVDTLHIALANLPNRVGGVPIELRPTPAIPTPSLGTAAAATYFVGFGLGHHMIGARAMPFFVSQLAGASALMIGIGVADHDDDTGSLIALSGFLALGVSRIWEIVDFISITSTQRRPVLSGSAPTSRGAEMSFVPMFDARRKGVALRYSF